MSVLARMEAFLEEGKPSPRDMKRGAKLVSKDNPEWGVWIVTGAAKGVPNTWEIRNTRRGHSRTLNKGELRFWRLEAREESVRALAHELRETMVIGAHGLEKTKSGLHVQPNTIYHIGASSSPKMVKVTRVSKNKVNYQEYPFGKRGHHSSSQMWIFQDLAIKGMNTWLKTYGKYQPKLAKAYKALLAGKKVRPNAEGYEPVVVQVKAARAGSGDLWRRAERYGSVGGIGDGDDMIYEISTDKNALDKLKKDRAFKVIKVQEK